MRLLLFLFCILFLFSKCSSFKNIKNQDVYYSKCWLYGEPSVIISFRPDKTCYYIIYPPPDTVFGEWAKVKDTIFIYSKEFNEDLSANYSEEFIKDFGSKIRPRKKFTEWPICDAYLIKNKNCIGCHLQKNVI
ncbi:MAG: hypothetical protein IPP79_18020 [Chitinophagaceae bacterium]|nr:hypothetical protein [Chitinophagaceae bacterium]